MPEQVWPAFANPPQRQPEIAFGRLASASTICGSLPPSSSTEPFIRSAHATPTPRPDLDRAGEEDLRGARLDQRLPDLAAAVHGAHDPLGQPGALEHLADPLADQRRERRRLQHHAVARHQRDRDLAERDRPRVVPRRDHADHAERLVGEAVPLLLAGRAAASSPARRRGSPAPRRRSSGARRSSAPAPSCTPRCAACPARARAARSSSSRLVDDHLRGAAHVARAVGQRQLRPERLHLAHVVDHGLDLVRRSVGTAPTARRSRGLNDSSSAGAGRRRAVPAAACHGRLGSCRSRSRQSRPRALADLARAARAARAPRRGPTARGSARPPPPAASAPAARRPRGGRAGSRSPCRGPACGAAG